MSRIAYLVHDLNDPAVARRVRMLQCAGENLVVVGFFRGLAPPETIAGMPAVPLARTADARLMQRVLAVLGNLLRPHALLNACVGADVVIGRNLEALALAARVQISSPAVRVVYECLDIHRLLLGRSVAARAIQRIEATLLRHVSLLIVSSPAFIREHFASRPGFTVPALLVENKLLAIDGLAIEPAPALLGPPWTIGWLGNLRCARSLEVLTALARRHAGQVHVLVAGRPSSAVFDDLPAVIAAAAHCTYLGPYTTVDQAAIYARCHFAWAIDWFEDGLNSSWLLPNRLYEAQAFGTVPITLRSVETGRWLARHGAGVLLDDGLVELDPALASLDTPSFAALRAAVDAIPRPALIADTNDCVQLAQAIRGQLAS